MNKNILYWEIISAAVIIALGCAFHFAFFWFNEWKPLAVLFAVNESVWEHCKIGFWPALIFSVVQYFFIGRQANNYWIAKAALTAVIPMAIIVMFYTYSGMIGTNYLPVDIGIFFASVIGGQLISYKLLMIKPLPDYYRIIALGTLIIMTVAFSTLTYHPGSIPLFIDANSGNTGILY